MKFTYAYKTSDGVRHEDAIEASSREDVFEILRGRGIKAIKVVAADGSKANGEIVVRGVRKRVAFTLAILTAAIVGGLVYFLGNAPTSVSEPNGSADSRYATARPRHWIGRTVSANFAHPSEKLLSLFAQPGVIVDEEKLPALDKRMKDDLLDALESGIVLEPDEREDSTDLKRVVVGLKQEAAIHLRGGADMETLLAFLLQRQKMEAGLRERLIADLSSAPEAEREAQRKNAEAMISTMGLEPLE